MSFLAIITLCLLILAVLGIAYLHHHFKVPRVALDQNPETFGLQGEPINIPAVSNKTLFGWWLQNPSDSDHTIVIMHGWGSSASQTLPLAIPFYEAGYNVLLPDARNHGHSDAHGFSSMPRFSEDIQASLSWLHEKHIRQSKRTTLVGHSVGAGASLLTASKRTDINSVISISAFSHPQTMMSSYLENWPIPKWLVSGILEYVQWKIGFRFDEIAPMNTAAKVNCPLLIVHGNADTTVPISEAHIIYENCRTPDCSLLEIEGAAHDSVEKIEEHGHEMVTFLQQNQAAFA